MVPLSTIRIRNLKALADASLELGQITVLIGPNGMGKSTVLQTLSLLRQSLDHPALQTTQPLVDLGTFAELVRDKRPPSHVNIDLGLNVEIDPVAGSLQQYTRQLYLQQFDQNGMLEQQTLDVIPALLDSEPISVTFNRLTGGAQQFLTLDEGRVGVTSGSGIGQPVGGFAFEGSFSPEAMTAIQRYFQAVRELLSGVYVVPPVRGFDATSYELLEGPVMDLFAARSWEAQASRVLSTIAYRRDLEDLISEFSARVLGVRVRARLMPGRRVAAEAVDGTTMNLVNEGFGVNQLVILLAQLVITSARSVLGVEEPEIHLHPLAQAQLADVFVQLAKMSDKQIILTTHSEHILLGLLSRVASKQLSPDDLAVYYFDKTAPMNPERLSVDEFGRLDGGLRGFFEANLNELEELLRPQDMVER